MKTYTFYFYDDPVGFRSDKKEEFVFSSSRFSVAFKAFVDFIMRSGFSFFIFGNYYRVAGRYTAPQFRNLPSYCYNFLDKLRMLDDD